MGCLCNHSLTTAGGTESVVLDLARALRRRGHEIVIYSPRAGHVASVLGGEMFPVVTHPSQLQEKPDIIHGQHHMETMIAVLSLPDTPAIYFCHGMMAWQECPPVHPRILRYVALADQSARRMFIERHLPVDKLTVIPNHIDLKNFLSGMPRIELKRAAICTRIAPVPGVVAAIRSVCEPRGISVDVIWDWSQGTIQSADGLFAQYDLIFGTGRTAIEAMAAGCAVSTSKDDKLGPLISAENFAARREFNFSLSLWENGFDPEELGRQIDAFRP